MIIVSRSWARNQIQAEPVNEQVNSSVMEDKDADAEVN